MIIHFLMGRTLTRLNDNFDFMLMINGVSIAGKSTIAKIALHSMYKSDIGILSKSLEAKFGLANFCDKQIVYCDDMPYNLPKVLDRGDFVAMMSRGSISCPVKGKTPFMIGTFQLLLIVTNCLPIKITPARLFEE